MSTRLPLAENPAGAPLRALAKRLADSNIQQLLADDPERAQRYSAEGAGLTLDYAKHWLDDESLSALLDLARAAGLESARGELLSGAPLNNTEARPALHTLLRATSAPAGCEDKFAEVEAVRQQMRQLVEALHNGERVSFAGKTFTDVVNIGIGGSDLGPRLVTDALQPWQGKIRAHYVANIDPADLEQTLASLDPSTTLLLICSKSFRTEETRVNGLSARQWLLDGGATPENVGDNCLAITTNLEAAAQFGIPAENCLPLWDWVGGRFSVWSAIGLSTAIAIGWDAFQDFLGGARAMDAHFAETPLAGNLPVLMSLLEVWYTNFHNAGNHVVLPYSHQLGLLPAFMQQLTMESNGKRVDCAGQALAENSAPVLWGESGTRGQHSFHQHLHQGTWLCPVDFILPLTADTSLQDQQHRLVAHCLAQSRALMIGRDLEQSLASLRERGVEEDRAMELAPHLVMSGNRPSSVLTMDKLTPETLGALLALYEHRTFCSGVLWGLNSFDQWGVELGKDIGAQVLAMMKGEGEAASDPATDRLLARWRAAEGG